MNNLVLIGKILTSHGLNGNVKVESYCEEPQDIFSYNVCSKSGESMPCKQVGKTSNPNIFLVKFDKINSINEAKEYKNFELFIKREDLEDLNDNQFYVNDLIGMKVVADNKEGIVDSSYNYGAGDVIEVKWNDGKMESIPFNDKYIKNIENNTIHIELPTYI